MPTQVRIFAMPKSLDETLAAGTPTSPLLKPVLVNGKVNGHINGNVNGSVNGHINGTGKPESVDLPTSMPVTMSVAEKPKEGGITFAAQDDLPKLPIPSLESSCQKYLAALKPLQGPREHAETRLAVQEFLKSDGPELQEKLLEYAEGKSSYIEQFCKCGVLAVSHKSDTNLTYRV